MNDPRTPEPKNREPVVQLLHDLEARLLRPDDSPPDQTRQLLQALNRSVEDLLGPGSQRQPDQPPDGDLHAARPQLEPKDTPQPQPAPSPTEELYRSIVENSIDAPYRRDLKTDRYDYLSPQIERNIGRTRDELLNAEMKTALSWIHPDDFSTVAQEMQRTDAECIQAGVSHGLMEYRYLANDGSYRWLMQHFTTLAGPDGRPLYRIGTIRDITRRKRAELALRESQSLLQAVMQETSDPIYVKDHESRFLLANPASLERIGKPADQVIGKNNAEFMDETELAHVILENDRQVIANGKAIEFEEQSMYRGKLHTYLSAKAPYRDASGAIIGVLAISRDITERKEKENELYTLNRTLRAISNCNQVMMHASSEAELMDAVCKIVVEDCGHTLVWIGFADDDEGKTVRPVAHAGSEADYLETLNITWADTERGRGPSGVAIREGQISVVRNMLTDPSYQPWQAEAIKRGFASVIVLPLIAKDKPFGVLSIYSKQPDPFAEAEVTLLTELSGDLAYGIVALRLKEAHARAEAALRESQTLLQTVMEGTTIPIFAKDRESRLIFANAAYTAAMGKPADQLIGKTNVESLGNTPYAHAILENDRRVMAAGKTQIIEEPSLIAGKVRTFLSSKSPYRDANGNTIGIIGISQDITDRKERELKLDQLNRTLRAISNCNQAMLHAETEAELMDAICKIVVEDCGHTMVWIGLAENDAEKSVRPVAYAGFEEGYLKNLKITWAEDERGRGPAGTAIRTGCMAASRNILTDPAFTPWRADAIQRGYQSGFALPLMDGGRAFGVLCIYSLLPDPFSDKEIELLSELSNDLAYGIVALRTKAAHARSEAALRENQTLLQAFLDEAPSSIFVKDRESHYLIANPGCLAALGKTAEQVLGKTNLDFQDDPIAAQLVLENDRKVMAEGRTELFEGQVIHDGRVHTYLNTKSPYRDASGAIIGIIGLSQDITERIEKENELSQLNRTLRAISSVNQAMLYSESEAELMDAVCKIVVEDCGHAMVWIGLAENDEAKSVRPVASAGFRDGYLETLNITWADTDRGRGPAGTAIRTGQITACRNMLTDPAFLPWRAEAIQRGYASSLALPLLSAGQPFGLLSIYSNQPDPFSENEINLLSELANDLAYGIAALRMKTAHAQAEAALRESQILLNAVMEGSPSPIFAKDRDSRMLLANPATLAAVGRPADQVLGKTDAEFYDDPAIGIAIIENDQRVLATGQAEILEERVAVGGKLRTFLSNKAPYRDAGGNIIGILGVAQDITDLKEKENELSQANRTLRALSNSNQAMLHAESEAQLMATVCKIVVEDCGHAMVWIGLAENDEIKSVRPVAAAGFEEGYLDTLKITWADTDRGHGPTGTAIRTGQLSACRNMLTDPAFQPWRAEAIKRGYASSLALPLMTAGQPFGAITIYSKHPDPFSENEIRLLSELSSDLAYGIMALRLKEAHAQVEAAMRASEERYRSLFEGMTEGFALHDIILDEQGKPCDYRFIEINTSFERMTGLKREQVIGRLHSEVLPDDDPAWVPIYGEVALTGQPVHFENYSPALKRAYEVISYRPAPLQFAVIFMDVTQRVQMEQELKEQAGQLREQADTLDLAHILVRDMENRISLWNRGAEKLYGWSKAEALGKVSHELFQTAFPDSLEEVDEALATTGAWEGELIHTRRDGTQVIVASHQVVHYDAEHRPVSIIEVNNDVTALKQAEETNAILARFPEENPSPIMRIGRSGKLQYANTASRSILDAWNCAPGDFIPKPWRDLSYSALANRERKIIVFRCRETLYELWFVPIPEAGYVNLYGRDITEQEKTAQELQKTLVELEVRVQKRTHDLTVAYEELYAETDERRRAEESVRKANEYNRGLLEASLDPLVTINSEGKISDVNAATERATGYTRGELLGTDFHQYFTDPDKARASYQQVFQTGMVRDYELDLRHRDGSRSQVLYNATVYRDASGSVAGVFAAARDITLRKQAEEQIHLQNMALESAANGIIITDTNGMIQWSNPAFAAMTGYSLEEVVGQNLRILNSGKHDAQFFKVMWETIRSGKVWRGEVTNRRKDGSLYVEDQMVTPVLDAQGVITSFIAIQQDISERKEAEQALLKSENRFRSLAENSSDIISRYSLNGVTLYISPACTSVLGYKPEQIIGRPFYEFIYPDDVAAVRATYRNIVSQPAAIMVTYRARNKAGSYIWLEATSWVIRDELTGEPVEIQSDMRDISERKRYEEALQEERQQLIVLTQAERQQRLFSEGLVQSTLALNSSLDANDIFDQILEQIQNVTPYQVATVALVDGNNFRLVRIRSAKPFPLTQADLPSDDSLDEFPLLKEMVLSAQILVIPDTDREPRWVKVYPWEWVRNYIGIPLQTRAGVAGFLNIFSDAPDTFDAETVNHLVAFANQASLAIHNAGLYKDIANALAHEQAMRAQMVQVEKYTAIGRMVAAITHEINNPLQSIKNCLYLTKQELSDAAEHPYLDMASKEVQRLSILVSQLREVYRPRSAGQKQWVNMLDLLAQVKVLLNHQLENNSVTWVQKPTTQKFIVFGLADQLKQVFLNISLNAIEAMGAKGGQLQIELVTDPETKMQGITLRDTGPGISAENLSRLFEPLFSTKQSGMGLGLSISLDIVQSHGGNITVESQEGSGTTFTVWLPLLNEENVEISERE